MFVSICIRVPLWLFDVLFRLPSAVFVAACMSWPASLACSLCLCQSPLPLKYIHANHLWRQCLVLLLPWAVLFFCIWCPKHGPVFGSVFGCEKQAGKSEGRLLAFTFSGPFCEAELAPVLGSAFGMANWGWLLQRLPVSAGFCPCGNQ